MPTTEPTTGPRSSDARVPAVPMGEPFTIVGYGCPHQLDRGLTAPLVIDAYGLELPGGRAVTYSLNANDPRTQAWAGPQEAADAFAGYLVRDDPSATAGSAGTGPAANDREADQ